MRQLLRFHKSNSGEIARSRLKLLLVADKIPCSPGFLELIKDDMIAVLSKYMEVDTGHVDIHLTRIESASTSEMIPALYTSIPIRQICNKGI